MNPLNHTPGPWHTQGCTIYAGKNRVAQTWDTCDDFPTPTMEADAHLISSAPDLLRALENLLSTQIDPMGIKASHARREAYEVIAKAKGQE